MMKRIWPLLKWFCILWGAVTFVVTVTFFVRATFIGGQREGLFGAMVPSSSTVISKAEAHTYLEQCDLGESHVLEVVHSYKSERAFGNDHLDAHELRIGNVPTEKLVPHSDGTGWYRCDQLDGVLADAVDFVSDWAQSGETSWFPSKAQLLTSDYLAFPSTIYCHGTRPSTAVIFFFRPADGTLFYIDSNT